MLYFLSFLPALRLLISKKNSVQLLADGIKTMHYRTLGTFNVIVNLTKLTKNLAENSAIATRTTEYVSCHL
jgi:hypothetical protein